MTKKAGNVYKGETVRMPLRVTKAIAKQVVDISAREGATVNEIGRRLIKVGLIVEDAQDNGVEVILRDKDGIETKVVLI